MKDFQKNWESVKNILSREHSDNPTYIDENDQIIVYIKGGTASIFGYMHIKNAYGSSGYITLTSEYESFVSDLKLLGKKWSKCNVSIITNIPLRKLGTGVKRLEGDVFYLQIVDDSLITQNIDQEYKKAKLDYSIRFEQQLRNASNFERGDWDCDICGGDSTTGCLYHDPTECPRHRNI